MKRVLAGLLGALLLITFVNANPYQAKSLYLRNPSKCVDFIVDQADFYALAKDEKNGGFYSYVDREGNPVYPNEAAPGSYWYWHWADDNDPGNDWLQWMSPYSEFSHHLKGVTAQSRVAYAFVRAFQISGNHRYLELAQHALDFMYKYGWDYNNGGWLFTTDEYGNLAPWIPGNWWDPNYFKWTYQQEYPLCGIAAMVEVTGGTRQVVPFPGSGMAISTDNDWLHESFLVFSNHMWDPRPDNLGYYMNSSNLIWDGAMWQNPSGKSFTGVVDAITTHASHLYLLTGQDFYQQRFNELGTQAATRLATSFGHNPWGFVTDYDSDWKPVDNNLNGGVSIGHMLKTAWVMARTYLATGNQQCRTAAADIINYIYENDGYDMVNGAPFAGASWTTTESVDEDGNPVSVTKVTIGSGKGHWETEQGVTAGLLNYAIADNPSDKERFLTIADESLDFFYNHFVDKEYGGSFYATDAEGNVTNDLKSDLWEQGYHAGELAYYAYLYGNLLYKNTPVRLFYEYAAVGYARDIQLNPIEGCDGRIGIQNVKLNGGGYRNFNSASRTLTIPAGVGGTFEVMFKNTAPGRW